MITEQNNLPNFLKSAIENQLEKETEKLIGEAKKELEKRTPEIIASVVFTVMQWVTFEDSKEKVVFTIKKDKTNL
jgi:hypothetical protein